MSSITAVIAASRRRDYYAPILPKQNLFIVSTLSLSVQILIYILSTILVKLEEEERVYIYPGCDEDPDDGQNCQMIKNIEKYLAMEDFFNVFVLS